MTAVTVVNGQPPIVITAWPSNVATALAGTYVSVSASNIDATLAPYNVVAGTATDQTAGIAAAMAALPSGGGNVNLPGGPIRSTTTIGYDKDNVTISGRGRDVTSIDYRGATKALTNSDPTQIRRSCGLADLTVDVRNATSGAAAVALDNMYRFVGRRVYLNGTGNTVVGLSVIGGATKSTYFSEWHDLDIVANTACVQLGNNCNAHRFFGGVYEGTGIAVNAIPDLNTTDTCVWTKTAFQTSGTNLVTLGAAAQVSDFVFNECRAEPGTPVNVTFTAGKGLRNRIQGGTWSQVTFIATAADGNVIWIPNEGIMQIDRVGTTARRTLDLRDANAGITLGNGTNCNLYRDVNGALHTDGALRVGSTAQIDGATTLTGAATFTGLANFTTALTSGSTISSNNLLAAGTNPDVNLELDAKGAGTIRTNATRGATGGTLLEPTGGKVGFYGTTPAAKPTVTGSRGGNAALASLLTQLATLGLITDSTTA